VVSRRCSLSSLSRTGLGPPPSCRQPTVPGRAAPALIAEGTAPHGELPGSGTHARSRPLQWGGALISSIPASRKDCACNGPRAGRCFLRVSVRRMETASSDAFGGDRVTGLGLARTGRWLCAGGAGLGAIGLLGWISQTDSLTTFVPNQPPMMPNTAVALLLLGASAAFSDRAQAHGARRGLAVAAAIAVLALGVSTLLEYALDVDFHIDQLLVTSVVEPHPGRPSPLTAVAVALTACAMLVFDSRSTARAGLSECLLVSSGLVAFTALLGQLFGAGPLYRLPRAPVVGVAVPTALSLLLTSVGLLLERPDAGLMRIVTSRGPGGILFRRLITAVVAAAVVLGFVIARLEPVLGLEDLPLLFAGLTVVTVVTSLVLLTVTAVSLNRTHEGLERSRAQTRDLVEQAPDGIFVADGEGRYTDVNGAGCSMLGYRREEIVGKTILDLIPAEDAERLSIARTQLLAGHHHVAEWKLRRQDGHYLPVEVSAKILPDGRWQGFVRDISERKRFEDERQVFVSLLENSSDFIGIADASGKPVYLNPAGRRMVGLPPDFPVEQTQIPDYYPPQERPFVTDVIVKSMIERGRWAGETYFRNWQTEAAIPVSDEHFMIRDPTGERVIGMGTVTRDMTDRKRAEEALRLSEARFSGILAVSADAIISIDESQRIVMFNDGAEKIFGYQKAEIIGAPLNVLVPERSREIHRKHVERFAAGSEVARRMGERHSTIAGRRKDGREFPADAAISRLEVSGRRFLTVALRDVTEQKRFEADQSFLAEVGAVLASTLEYEETVVSIAELAVRSIADLCIVDIAADDGEARLQRAASRAPSTRWVCDLLARAPLDRERLRPLWAALKPERAALIQPVTLEAISSALEAPEHLRALHAVDPKSAIVVPLATRGRLLGVIALVSSSPSRVYGPADVNLAEELARRAALSIDNARLYGVARRAIRARDDILGIVAHDLRNPLGAVLLQAGSLRRTGGQPERRSRRAPEAIERAATRMDRLIRDMLDVTRLEAGRLPVEPASISLEPLVADSLEAQKALAASGSVDLQSNLAHELPPVWADRDRLLQVLENLIGNALKFTEARGCITVGAAPRGDEVLVWVADTGTGIPAEHLPHLFDRFWRARPNERRGAGLGLTIVKGIVEAHGGRIWVESTPGRGSTFFFTIPTSPHANLSRPEATA
jgi:PAS domain S-box-containing protein